MMHCNKCLIPEGLLLLDDYYPVGEAYAEEISKTAEHRISRIVLDKEKICTYCRTYAEQHSEEKRSAELRRFAAETNQETVVLALSGGKDSLTALYLAHEIIGLNLRCLLYQNGFIPETILDQTKQICNKLNVPLDIVEHSLASVFEKEYPLVEGQRVAQTGVDFCAICAKKLGSLAGKYLKLHHAKWILFGTKTYARLHPYVSAVQYHQWQGYSYQSINLLFAMKINTQQQQHILERLDWKDPELEGYTTNCKIPGLVKSARQKKLGMASDQGYIEAELRSGAFTHEEALELLAKEA